MERRVALKEQRIQRMEKETGLFSAQSTGAGGRTKIEVRRREGELKYSVLDRYEEMSYTGGRSQDGRIYIGGRSQDGRIYTGDRNQDARTGRGTMRADELILPVGERLSKARDRSRSPVDVHRAPVRVQERRAEGWYGEGRMGWEGEERLSRDEGTGVRSRLGAKL